MKKVMEKEKINRLMNNNAPLVIRDVAIDLIEYLSSKGYNVLKYIAKMNKTEFIVYDGKNTDNLEISFEVGGEKRNINNINWNFYEGFYLPILDLDEDQNYKLFKEVLAINTGSTIKPNNKYFKQKILHELLHLFSATNNIITQNGEKVFYTGINKFLLNKDDGFKMLIEKGNTEVNEAMTEVISYKIYAELYEKKFFIPSVEKDGMLFPYIHQYYLMTGVMRIINLFAYTTTNIDVMLFSYMNNNLEYYESNLLNTLGITNKTLRQLFYVLQIYMEKFLNNEECIESFKACLIPFLRDITNNLYISLKNIDAKNEYKKLYISYAIDYIEYLTSYPIFISIKKEFLEYLDKLKTI